MANRDCLKRYGFCLTSNKYNRVDIKLRLEPDEPDFKYRKFIIEKFFSVDKSGDTDDIVPEGERAHMDIQSRHFRIYYQRLNTKVLKFIKILTFNPREDDLNCIIQTRSLGLEYLSLKKLRLIYEDFLKTFPTTLEEDLKILRGPQRKTLNVRQYFAVVYRSEQKRILIN